MPTTKSPQLHTSPQVYKIPKNKTLKTLKTKLFFVVDEKNHRLKGVGQRLP
jgi:hypothetical protein